jgi:hypothetical protein
MKLGVPRCTLYKCDLLAYTAKGYELGEIGAVVASSKQDVTASAILRGDFELLYACVSKTKSDIHHPSAKHTSNLELGTLLI